MATSQFSSAPVAPATVDFWLGVKLRREGRRDAKKYVQLSDYTRTHAMIVAQNRALAGQREVNQWLIKKAGPLQVGNARLNAKLELFAAELERLRKFPGETNRARRDSQWRVDLIEREILNTTSQINANSAQLASLVLAAEQALGSWGNYYEQMAGIYARARAIRLRQDVDSARAEVPILEPIQLVDFEQTEVLGMDPKAGKKR